MRLIQQEGRKSLQNGTFLRYQITNNLMDDSSPVLDTSLQENIIEAIVDNIMHDSSRDEEETVSEMAEPDDEKGPEEANTKEINLSQTITDNENMDDDNNQIVMEETEESPIPKQDEQTDEAPEENELQMIEFDTNIDREEVEAAYRDLVYHGKVPYDSLIPHVMQELTRQKLAALASHNYEFAKAHEKAASLLTQQIEQTSVVEADTHRKLSMQSRAAELKRQLRDAKAKWRSRMEQHNNNSDFKIRQLREKQAREISEFRERFKDPALLQKFSRPSRDLIRMRRTEKQLALSKMYQEAARVKEEADKLQAQEEQQMRQMLEKQIQNEYDKLNEIHEKEMQRLTTHGDKTKAKIEAEKLKELEPIEATIQGLEVRKQETMNKRLLALQLLSNGNSRTGGKDHTKIQYQTTPRSQAKLKNFRNQKVVEMTVKPATDDQFERLEMMNKRRTKLPMLNTKSKSTL